MPKIYVQLEFGTTYIHEVCHRRFGASGRDMLARNFLGELPSLGYRSGFRLR